MGFVQGNNLLMDFEQRREVTYLLGLKEYPGFCINYRATNMKIRRYVKIQPK